MVSFRDAIDFANALEGVSVRDHFGSDAYSANGRIFATFWPDKNEVNVRLNPEDQVRFLEEAHAFREIPNAWGKAGMTTMLLDFVDRGTFVAALRAAWGQSAKKTPLPRRKKTR